MNEMIQEAVLNSIDVIDEAQLFAEYDVLMAMADVYAKSAFIQESNNALAFDGYNIIQEAADEDNTNTEDSAAAKTGKLSKVKSGLKSAGSSVLAFLKRIWQAIAAGFSAIYNKIKSLIPKKVSGTDIKSTVENGGDVVLKVEVAERLGLPYNVTKEVVKSPEFEKKITDLKIDDFEYYKVPIKFSPRAIEPCVEHIKNSFEAYKEMMDGGLDKAQYQDRKKKCNSERVKAYKYFSKGTNAFAGGKVAEKVDYKEIHETLKRLSPVVGDILKQTREIEKRVMSLKFGDASNGMTDVELNDLRSLASLMPQLPKSLLNAMNEMRDTIHPTNVKKRAAKKMEEADYEDAEDAFMPKGQED